jgi:hypothetical protein
LGNDEFAGGADADILDGGAGNDTLVGGAGIDSAVLGESADSYTFVLNSDGTVEVVASDGSTDVLSGVEQFDLGTGTAPLTELLPDVQLVCERHAAKVQSYFLGALGREASADELAEFTETLQSNQGRVWWNADISGTSAGTDSLMGYLMSRPEYVAATDGTAAVNAAFMQLTGQAAPEELIEHYVERLNAGTLQAQGLVNKMIGDLWLSPKGDGSMGTPPTTGFFDNREWLDGAAYRGYLDMLDASSGVDIANLDANGNLVELVGTTL